MAREITKYDDVIDSRDVIARIEELEALRIELAPEPLDEDDDQELADLHALAEAGEASSDWQYGEALIRDSYFERYAEELADDIGAVDEALSNRWPYTCIDWAQAARELQNGYMGVDFDGVTYWLRA